MDIVVMELHNSWKWMVLAKLQLCNSCNLFDSTHNVRIKWVANGHRNSKIELQGRLQNTFFSHNVYKVMNQPIIRSKVGVNVSYFYMFLSGKLNYCWKCVMYNNVFEI